MAYTDQYDLSQDAIHRKRVQIAMAVAATQIGGEAQASFTVEQWDKRAQLAADVLRDPLAWIDKFAIAVGSNAVIVVGSTDNDIQFTVDSIWDDMAGVTGRNLT